MPKPSPGHSPDPMAGVVDRLLAQLPGLQSEPKPTLGRARSAGQWTTPTVISGSGSTPPQPLRVWARVLLGLALAVMMGGWPYFKGCGLPLAGYLGSVLTVILAGTLAACAAWRYRSALAHLISLLILLFGLILATAELLPRIGYAVDRATWGCEKSP